MRVYCRSITSPEHIFISAPCPDRGSLFPPTILCPLDKLIKLNTTEKERSVMRVIGRGLSCLLCFRVTLPGQWICRAAVKATEQAGAQTWSETRSKTKMPERQIVLCLVCLLRLRLTLSWISGGQPRFVDLPLRLESCKCWCCFSPPRPNKYSNSVDWVVALTRSVSAVSKKVAHLSNIHFNQQVVLFD